MKFIPTSGNILVQEVEDKKPFTTSQDVRKARVIAVSPDTIGVYNGKPHVCPCKVGDVIQHEYKYEGDVELDGKKYKIVKFESVLGVYAD